jgi:trehalose 6-phosphate synthase
LRPGSEPRLGGTAAYGSAGAGELSADPQTHITSDGSVTYASLDLEKQDYEGYYNGYANRVLWPLFHFRAAAIEFSREDLDAYLRVNEQFARHVSPALRRGDLVWAHDYHLIPFGEALRRRNVDVPIGFFLHTPFPSAELLRALPNRVELVRALCAYDLVGFQTANDLNAFRGYLVCEQHGEDLGNGRLRAFGRVITARAFPIGIDAAAMVEQAPRAATLPLMRAFERSLNGCTLIIGVDRLDYSKGLLQRLAAYERLLERYPRLHGRVAFMQIALPTRGNLPEYVEVRRDVEAAVSRINGRFAALHWNPIRYLNTGFDQDILVGIYRAAQIAIVTPLRDGMNLVAKEYVASQNPAAPGVLILSCLAGAASELDHALIVHPFDVDSIAEAISRALDMPLHERRARWIPMMAELQRNDITVWQQSFVRSLIQSAAGWPVGAAGPTACLANGAAHPPRHREHVC